MIFVTKYLKNTIIMLSLFFNVLNMSTILYLINQNNFIIGYSRQTPLIDFKYIFYFLFFLFLLKLLLYFINNSTIKVNLYINILKYTILLFNVCFLLGTGFLFFKIFLMFFGECESISIGFTGLYIFRIYTHEEIIYIANSFYEWYIKETICNKLGINLVSFYELINEDVLKTFETPEEVKTYLKDVIDVWDEETFCRDANDYLSKTSDSKNYFLWYSLITLLISTSILFGLSYYLGYSGFFGFFTFGKKDNKSVIDNTLEKILSDNKKIISDNKDLIKDNKALKLDIDSLKEKNFIDYDYLRSNLIIERKFILNVVKNNFVLKGNRDPGIHLLYKELKKLNNNNIDQALKDLFG